MAQSNEITKHNLKALLKDIGLKATEHTLTVKAYDSIKSDKSIKNRINDWIVIGNTANMIKSHLASQKTNLNSGLFGDYFKTYYPRISDNERSAAMWLDTNQKIVLPINSACKIPGSNPEVIRRNIRKSLGAKKAKDTEYKKAGLTAPKTPKTPTVEKKIKLGDSLINLEKIDTAPTSAILNWVEACKNELLKRSQGKNISGEFSSESLILLEKISTNLADIQVDVSHRLKNKSKQKSASK